MTIAIAGATGLLGGHVATAASAQGHRVVPLARSLGTDLTTGEGLDAALEGVDAVVDVTNVQTQKETEAVGFFTSVTSHLLEHEVQAGVGHHVAVSIVGIDTIGMGYYRGKLAQENTIAQGAVPWSVLRATQFHEFAEQAMDFVRLGPISLVPRMPARTVAARDVAEALIDLVEAGPSGRVPDLGGPEDNEMVDLARRTVRAKGQRRYVVPVRVPGAAGRAIAAGDLRPASTDPHGSTTFAEWLSDR